MVLHLVCVRSCSCLRRCGTDGQWYLFVRVDRVVLHAGLMPGWHRYLLEWVNVEDGMHAEIMSGRHMCLSCVCSLPALHRDT